MFGHPTRNAFALVATSSWFLLDDANSCLVTRYGPFPKILEYMRIAVEVPCFSHRDIDKCSVNSGQSAYCAIGCRVSPSVVRLSNLENIRKKEMEKGSLSHITVSEGLIPRVESSFLWLANIEVHRNHPKGFRVEWPVWSDKPQSFTQVSQGQVGFEMDIDNNQAAGTRQYVHNVVSGPDK